MDDHKFILKSKSWLGEGKIQLNMVEEELDFYTRWQVMPSDEEGAIRAVQEIQIKGLSDIMHNRFIFTEINNGKFLLELENQALGKVVGTGIFDKKLIAWEFRLKEIGFEGFEFYEKQKDGSYLMRAEYATTDQFRTAIRGKVWEKMPEKVKESL
jgi:hypothetical protein